jgi:hypothetical protein
MFFITLESHSSSTAEPTLKYSSRNTLMLFMVGCS